MSTRSCEVVVGILETWPSISTSDIVRIRDIVLSKKFNSVSGLTDDGLVALTGDAYEEMCFLHEKLCITVDEDVANREIWYISERLKKKRKNDMRVKQSTVRELSSFLGTEVFKYAELSDTVNEKWRNLLKNIKKYTPKTK